MYKINKNGECYLDALDLVGLNGSDLNAKITYVSDNGEEKILYEDSVLHLGELFRDNNR